MRRILLISLLLLFCGLCAVAQDAPKGELFAGYSFLHFDCGGCNQANVPAGFEVDGTYYFARVLGLTADFDYHKKTLPAGTFGAGTPAIDLSATGLHFGPRVKARVGKVEPFAHALFGFTHLSGSGGGQSASENDFSMKLGGGLDVVAARHFAIRLGEFNYYYTKFPVNGGGGIPSPNGQDHQNNITFSAGIVIR